MKKVWYIADTHFGHGDKILTWRPQFSSVRDMEETIVANINGLVKPEDTLILLGDIVITQRGMWALEALNGYKVLIPGNHDGERDGLKLKDYPVDKIQVARDITLNGMHGVLTHIPVHPDELDRWKFNVHGHTHDRIIHDPRYICVSCEMVNYSPVDKEYLTIRAASITL